MAPTRGDGLLSATALIGLALWLLNDHLLQPHWGGFISGKLGDVASLMVLPLALQAAVELAQRREGFRPSQNLATACCICVGVFFAWMEATELGSLSFRTMLAVLRWPVHALRIGALPELRLVSHVADVEDLITLPALLLPYRLGKQRAVRGRDAPALSRPTSSGASSSCRA
jgi:hypothetical protein